jgi:hypothetical protein
MRQLEEAEVKLEEGTKSNMMAATRRAGTAHPFGAHEFTPVFSGVCSIFSCLCLVDHCVSFVFSRLGIVLSCPLI